ncbi:MAG: carboxypeptidase-like regulatory domain-containing protein [Bacilli bacterium]
MERETRMLLWTLFAIGVLTVGLLPAAWGTLNHAVATGVKSNNDMAQALWGQSPPLSPSENNWLTNTNVPIIPGAVLTHVDSVSWNTSTWGPQLVIAGYGFGNPPSAGQTALIIRDTSRNWAAADSSAYGVQPVMASWQNDRIVVGGFNGYGATDVSNGSSVQESEVFAPGDRITVSVTNPQTGSTGSFQTQYPPNAPMPIVTMDPLPSLIVGQSEPLSGRVSLAGTGLADQTVTLNWSGGNVTTAASTIRGQILTTDGSGRFSVTYTAPAQPGTYTVSASADTGYAAQQVQVNVPTVAIAPVPTVEAGQSVMITGHVTGVGGAGMAGQMVTLSANGGQIRPETVVTDSRGNFTATYTAPGTGDTESVMASCDGGMGMASVTVRAFTVTLSAVGDPTDNQVTLTATVNQPLNGTTLRILDETTGQTLAQTDQGTTLSTQITMQQDVTQTFVAQID